MQWPTAILSALLLCSTSLAAQETATESEAVVTDTQQAEAAQVAEKPDNSANRRQTGKADEYEATEEISEDLSVSYPVDI